jgi:cytochrome c553
MIRWAGRALAAIALLLLFGIGGIYAASQAKLADVSATQPERLGRPTPQQLADAPRQARILGCYSCHGAGLGGKMMEDIPNVIRVHAPNLTDVAARATDEQLAAAIRQGIGTDGRPLFVMPSPMYARLSDGEVGALIAHIRSLPRTSGRAETVSFGPVGRFALATGKLRAAPEKVQEFRSQAPLALGAGHEAGRRLTAINCSECHGPALFGATMEDGNVTPDLRIASGYDLAQFTTLMRTGKAPHGRDLGLMAYVARNDFSHYTDGELAAIHRYLSARADKLGS